MHWQVFCLIFGILTWNLAIIATTAAIEGKMGKGLKKLLKKVFASSAHDTLAVADSKLGNLIKASLAHMILDVLM